MRQQIWFGTIDGHYQCVVWRDGPDTGTLVIRDGDAEIHSEPVALSYGAAFGPDAADVADWKDICERVIDARAS